MPAFYKSSSEPPLADSYNALLHRDEPRCSFHEHRDAEAVVECELPVVDLRGLASGDAAARAACGEAMARAAAEWGFFQVLNHGVRRELMEEMRREEMRLFRLPFETKAASGMLNASYRWGTATATSLRQLSWSEAFHVPLVGISREGCDCGELTSLRRVTQEVANAMSKLAKTLAQVLAAKLGHCGESFPVGCDETTCFLRLNRYPPCPFAPDAFGLVPHTDSDFLTVLCQDKVGGLQLMKDGRWVAVKPNPDALIVNIGDLFQAWSNNRYKSVEHKVMPNAKTERYSVAYFLCPSYDSPIGTCTEPSPYKNFTFGEYRRRVQEDVKATGRKIGLPNFLL